MMGLDNALWLIGLVIESAVVGLIAKRRVWRTFPVFSAYCGWILFTDAGVYLVHHFLPASYYFKAYFGEMAVDSALEFAVLIELSWSVLRPLRSSLSRRTPFIIGAFILAVGGAIWPFVTVPGLSNFSTSVRLLVQLEQSTSILRVLFFLLLAGCSQLLSIGWRDRELQIATGLGFFSIVSLAVEMVHTHEALGAHYNNLNRFVVASYLCSLAYWAFSFAQKEAERREFTPQMQSFLLAVAGAARANRIALSESSISESKNRPNL